MAVSSIRKILTGSVCAAAILCFTLAPAQAGFEWTPPAKASVEAPASPAAPGTAAATPAPYDPNLLTPEPDAAPTAPVAPVEGAKLEPEDLIVPDMAAKPATTAPQGIKVVQPAPAMVPPAQPPAQPVPRFLPSS